MKRLIFLLTAALVFTSAQADLILKQSTASQAVKFGPFVDDTDGKTAETALTIANTDVRLSKNGATMAAKNSGGCTHDAVGYYTCTLDATDTNTVGRLQAMVSVAGALPVYQEFNVVEEAVYDAYYGASAPGYVANAPVNVVQYGGTNGTFTSGQPTVRLSAGTGAGQISLTSGAVTAGTVSDKTGYSIGSGGITEASFATTAGSFAPLGVVDQGTAQAATGTTLQLRSAATFANTELVGATCVITGGSTGVGQARVITGYVGSTDTATVDTWTTTPTGTITYKCFGTAPSSGGGGGLDAAGVRAAVGLASANLDTQLSGIQSDTDNIQTRIPAALVSGRMDSSVGAMANNVMTAAAAATDLGTEIGTATWATTTRTLSAGTNIVLAKGTGITGFNDPAASAIADAVWDEARTGHTTAGTFGYYLDSAISGVSTGGVSAAEIADAVWDETLSGHTTGGSAGERLGRVPNAAAGGNGGLPTVNASNQVAGVSGNVNGTVNGLTSTAQGNVRTALGMSSANLDTQLSGLSSAASVIDGIVDQLLVGVNVSKINTKTIVGDGSGTPFNVAP